MSAVELVDAPPTPSGARTPDTLAVFVGLGVALDPIVDARRFVGDALYLTSANRSGQGNTVQSAALPKDLLAGSVEALLDDRLIPMERRCAMPAKASPMARLGVEPYWVRLGAGQEDVWAQLRGAGIDVPAFAAHVRAHQDRTRGCRPRRLVAASALPWGSWRPLWGRALVEPRPRPWPIEEPWRCARS